MGQLRAPRPPALTSEKAGPDGVPGRDHGPPNTTAAVSVAGLRECVGDKVEQSSFALARACRFRTSPHQGKRLRVVRLWCGGRRRGRYS